MAVRTSGDEMGQAYVCDARYRIRTKRDECPDELTIGDGAVVHTDNDESQDARRRRGCVKDLRGETNLGTSGGLYIDRLVPFQVELHTADSLTLRRKRDGRNYTSTCAGNLV